jgi:hypothetical protein
MVTATGDLNNTQNDVSFHDHDSHLIDTMADLLSWLWQTSKVLDLNIVLSIENKLKLNAKKYPVEHCKVCFLLPALAPLSSRLIVEEKSLLTFDSGESWQVHNLFTLYRHHENKSSFR